MKYKDIERKLFGEMSQIPLFSYRLIFPLTLPNSRTFPLVAGFGQLLDLQY